MLNSNMKNIRSGILTVTGIISSTKPFTVKFAKNMPSNLYAVIITPMYGGNFETLQYAVSSKSTDGFVMRVGNTAKNDVSSYTYNLNWIAISYD